MNGSWDAYLASPADFAGAGDITTNLAKERKPEIEIIERTTVFDYCINSSYEFLWTIYAKTVFDQKNRLSKLS